MLMREKNGAKIFGRRAELRQRGAKSARGKTAVDQKLRLSVSDKICIPAGTGADRFNMKQGGVQSVSLSFFICLFFRFAAGKRQAACLRGRA